MAKEKCADCEFWTEDEECRRFPPGIGWGMKEGEKGRQAAFPIVPGDRWCGEFQLKRHLKRHPEGKTTSQEI